MDKKQPKWKNNQDNEKQVHSSSSLSAVKVLLLLFAILTALVSMYMYRVTTTPPAVARLDPSEWVGPDPNDQNPDLSNPSRSDFLMRARSEPEQLATSTDSEAEGAEGTEHSEGSSGSSQSANYETASSVYEFTARDIHGAEVKLERYRGYVLLIVNVASECGLTDTNYRQLNQLHHKYADTRGLRILAFPCDQFGAQEPGTSRDILSFTRSRGVQFHLFEKVQVNGVSAHPLWRYLTRAVRGSLGDYIKWNFSKFIVDRSGRPVERFAPYVDPLDLEPHLHKYW